MRLLSRLTNHMIALLALVLATAISALVLGAIRFLEMCGGYCQVRTPAPPPFAGTRKQTPNMGRFTALEQLAANPDN